MAGKKQVLMLLSNPFRPDPRVHKEALSLIKAGYGVTILCWDREQSHPKEEVIDGITVKRMGPASGYGHSGDIMKKLPRFWNNLRKAASLLDYDMVHAHDLDTLSPGLRMAARSKVPLIYDSHEIYHEMAAENLSGPLVKLLAAYERHMVRKPRIIITVNEPIAKMFRGWGARDVKVIMNCQPEIPPDPGKVEALRRALVPGGGLVALYIGVLEPGRLLLELAHSHSKGTDDFFLVMGGFGSLEPPIRRIAERSNGRVRFIGMVKPADVPAHNAAASVLLAAYDPGLKNNRMGAPNKLFEAMAASKPIVVSKGTYAATVVGKSGSGLAAEYNAVAVLTAAQKLMNDPVFHARCASSGRRAYEEKYNWGVMEKRLLAAYSDLLRCPD